MKTNRIIALALLGLLTLIYQPSTLFALGTEFTYQGRLNSGSNPANGNYDFRFAIWNAESGPSLVSGTVGTNALAVSNGLFTVTLDFGPGIFTGADRWLEINVRTNGTGSFDTLSLRQKLTATPYAVTAGSLVSGGLAGTYSNAVTFSNPANSFSGAFFGNGGGLSNVNALTLGGLSSSNFWKTAGNAGTTPGLNFLGTTDNQPLELQVNGTRALRLEPHATSAPSLVGGYLQNSVSSYHGAVVAGGGTSGSPNYALGNYAFVGAGHGGQAADYSAVVGGAYNVSPGLFSFIGSGLSNTNRGDYSFIGGGSNNIIAAGAANAFISGGVMNLIQSDSSYGFIGGGQANAIASNANHSFIGGGSFNTNTGGGAFIGGGIANRAGNFDAVVVGGALNVNTGLRSFIGGGEGNVIEPLANGATIAGGRYNSVSNSYTPVIGGGEGNVIEPNTQFATLGGGRFNNIRSNNFSPTIAGGEKNIIRDNASFSTIGGGLVNLAAGEFATIGGGGFNEASGRSAVVGGGGGYDAGGGGPYPNVASGDWSTVSGGWNNSAAGYSSVVGGGGVNISGGYFSTVSGGGLNISGGYLSTVGGGYFNKATNAYAVVPGGDQNTAGGQYSFAAGQRAQALHDGSFVWADSQNADFTSTTNDQFSIRAAGGVRLHTDTSLSFGTQTRQMLNLWGTAYGIGVQSYTTYMRADDTGNFAWYTGGIHNDAETNAGGGLTLMVLNTSGLRVNGTFVSASDRNVKRDFAPVDSRAVLEKVVALPVQTWAYNLDPGTRHLGPVAQDFQAAFGLGADDKSIATVDADGVALVAIQGLNQKVEDQQAELKTKDVEIQELKRAVKELRESFDKLAHASLPEQSSR